MPTDDIHRALKLRPHFGPALPVRRNRCPFQLLRLGRRTRTTGAATTFWYIEWD
jgi:hypothetical protein